MNYEDYIAISSEIAELKLLLAEIPEANVLERIGLEARLTAATALIADFKKDQAIYKARLTF